MGSSPSIDLRVEDLGRMAYAPALELQRARQRAVIDGRQTPAAGRMHLLLVEHDPPVITVSRRPGAGRHLTATPEQLAAAGVEVCETDRGGDITYHGPGQLVVYPILDLNVLGVRLHGYMRWLEQIVIDTIGGYGLVGERDAAATGVWVGNVETSKRRNVEMPKRRNVETSKRRNVEMPKRRNVEMPKRRNVEMKKVCAMGVRVSRWVSMHGLALNVRPDFSHFDLIVPCGLVGRSVTSLANELGDACPSMETVKVDLVNQFQIATLDARLKPGSS